MSKKRLLFTLLGFAVLIVSMNVERFIDDGIFCLILKYVLLICAIVIMHLDQIIGRLQGKTKEPKEKTQMTDFSKMILIFSIVLGVSIAAVLLFVFYCM